MARSRRCYRGRRLRREHGRRVDIADGGSAAFDDDPAGLGPTCSTPGSRRRSATCRTSGKSSSRLRPLRAWARRRDALLPRHRRHGRHDGAAARHSARHRAARGTARAGRASTGVKHQFDVPSTADIFTWTVTYLDAEVRRDPAAQAKLLSMTSVQGAETTMCSFRTTVPLRSRRRAQFRGTVVERAGRLGSRAGASISRTRAT